MNTSISFELPKAIRVGLCSLFLHVTEIIQILLSRQRSRAASAEEQMQLWQALSKNTK